MLLQWLGVIASILVVDLALSGGHALVIGAGASKLPARQQRTAIVFGGAMAIVLRIPLASLAVFLVQVPCLPPVLLLAGLIPAWTSGTMVRDDKAITPFVVALDQQVPGPPLVWVMPAVFVVGLAIVWLVLQGRRSRHVAKPG